MVAHLLHCRINCNWRWQSLKDIPKKAIHFSLFLEDVYFLVPGDGNLMLFWDWILKKS